MVCSLFGRGGDWCLYPSSVRWIGCCFSHLSYLLSYSIRILFLWKREKKERLFEVVEPPSCKPFSLLGAPSLVEVEVWFAPSLVEVEACGLLPLVRSRVWL